MGRSLIAHCDCGYTSKELLCGGGMKVGVAYIPYMCRTCRELFHGNPYKKRVRCPTCNKTCRTHVPWKNFKANIRWRMGKLPLTCPKCFQKTLLFRGGLFLWD